MLFLSYPFNCLPAIDFCERCEEFCNLDSKPDDGLGNRDYCSDCYDAIAELAWERRMTDYESGSYENTPSYRDSLRDAGRSHLLPW